MSSLYYQYKSNCRHRHHDDCEKEKCHREKCHEEKWEKEKCEKEKWDRKKCKKKEKECEYVGGVVTSGSLIGLAVTTNPIPLPLTNPSLITECVSVAPTGGLIVEEDGDYLIHFSAGILVASLTGGLGVYAGSRFLGSVGPLSAIGLSSFSAIVRLERGELVQVIANGPIVAGVLSQGSLTVAKISD
ncbi:hypothetical protein [Sutcliffiella rhizosphaerae]|uniref:AT-hook motif nuclear-localized protein n=1 Tax=Sutcliffiella rhizosphaerae TaxID=2880967 RepID=A0ABM8YKM7_9BACI|nr:hypothetical protein [Sutcliffiella rhizosphaerae]CAG9620488.1 hypothetical protein BACCIP111883_01257 [Sutcliffiella rhizosphaerae]